MKKLPNSVSTEDLLKALDETTEASKPIDEIFDFRNDVPVFLSKYNIQSGENQVAKRSLYSLYVRSSEAPVSRKTFLVAMGNFVTDHTRTTFALNKTKMEINALIQNTKPVSIKYSPAHVKTRKHFEDFLEQNNIRSGTKWVESEILLYVYQKWCRENRKSIRFKPNTFVKMLKLFLDNKKTTHYANWFRIDEAILTSLTEKDRRNIQDERRKRDQEYKESKAKQR